MIDIVIGFLQRLDSEFAIRHLLLLFFAFGLLEYFIPLHAEQKRFRSTFLTDVCHMLFSGKALGFIVAIVFPALVSLMSNFVPDALRISIETSPWIIQVIGVVIIGDFGIYVMHRLMHSVPLLWKFHAVHHSSTELDWMSTYRFHPIDQIMIRGVSLLPVFILNFSTSAILAALILYEWHSILLHANVKVNFGPLRWIFVTPDIHHWHHANEEAAYNKNFSSQLVIWDRIFNTYFSNHKRAPQYGVSEPVPRRYIGQLFHPFRGIVQNRSKQRSQD